MGFFDKVKDTVNKIKEDNKYFARTTSRMNNKAQYYGRINCNVKDGDFRQGSYVNVEGDTALIYNVTDEDYLFKAEDIMTFELMGDGQSIRMGEDTLLTIRFKVEFKDGKHGQLDLIVAKVDSFKAIFKV